MRGLAEIEQGPDEEEGTDSDGNEVAWPASDEHGERDVVPPSSQRPSGADEGGQKSTSSVAITLCLLL